VLSSSSRIRLGSLFGHEIQLDLVAAGAFALIVLWGREPIEYSVAFLVAAFFSIFWHEMGHAVAIRRLLHQDALVVLGLGGYTISLGPRSGRHQFLISLAGPLAGFVLGAIGWGIALLTTRFTGIWPWEFFAGGSVWLLTLRHIVWISVVWGVANLVPAMPLDGGQALRALLVATGVNPLSARRFTRRLSMAIAIAVGIWAWQSGFTFLAFLCLWILWSNADEARAEGW